MLTNISYNTAEFCMQDFGGAGTAALRLHEGLTREGANNTFYVQNIDKWKDKTALLSQAHPSTKNEKFISPEWRAFQALNNQALSRYPNRPSGLEMFSIPWAATKLKDIPELQDADVINLHWISGTLSIPDNIDFLKGKKIVWTLHDMNPFTGGCHYAGECRGYEKYCGNCPQLGSNQENDLSREIWKLKKSAYRELDIEIVVLCDWMAKCVKKSSLLSSVPVHVIPNGLPTDVFRPYPQDQIRESLQVPKDAFVILFGADSVTNVRKGFVHLLRALEYLKESDISEQIALVTFGHNAQAEVQHLGFPTFAFDYVDKESELALVYSMADVTVIPSLEDNLPNVVLESLACGTPVVGFDVGGIPDMIEHQINGYLAPIATDKELANGMRWIMERKKAGSKIGFKCRETALSGYNLPLQAKRYLELYESISK
jgi:glycosyltransferase involved in cell wall biosynthesis